MLELVCNGHSALILQISLVPGVRLEALGQDWVAFSALSGETHQLNPEAAAVLELLAAGPLSESALCAALAADTGVDATEIQILLRDAWSMLESAGLIRTAAAHGAG